MAKKTDSLQPVVTFHNKVSANFKQVHVDGAFGGITPPGYINMNFYGERFPIPKSTNYILNDNQTVGEQMEHSDDSKVGIIREYEFGIYCDLKTAISIRNFLNNQIVALENNEKEKNAIINSK